MNKYSDELLAKFRGSFPNELLGFVCGDSLGQGMTREVFHFGNTFHDDPDSNVIKFELDSGHFQNVTEWQLWDHVKHADKLAKWFAPCVSISHCGRILLQRYCEPIPAVKLPAEVPAFFTDLKPSNWGIYKGHPVALDYGKHLMLERGMTTRMRRADWT